MKRGIENRRYKCTFVSKLDMLLAARRRKST
jgi:hypothetical protein